MASLLKIQNLKFKWPGTKNDLLNIENLELQKAEKLFLKGPSGSGKSSLLNLIAGTLSPQSGSIEFLGLDITKTSDAKKDCIRGDHMGFIFQMFNLLPYLNAIENIKLSCQFSKTKSKKVLQKSPSVEEEALRLLRELALDPESIKDKSTSKLSVGQQQRVATARALIGSPDLIIADEPTSALDTEVRDRFIDLLFKECDRSKIALLFVSHDPSLAKHFDRQISIKEINKAAAIPSDKDEFSL